MKPDWEDKEFGVQLYCRDCLDVLPHLSKVGAVIADPPFGIGFKYNTHKDQFDGYGEWIWSIIEKCERLCISGSPIFVWQTQLHFKYFHMWFPRDWRICIQAKNFIQLRKTPMQYAYDPVLTWWTDGKIWNNTNTNRDWFVANTASHITKTSALQRQHPCPRPIDFVIWVVDNWVHENRITLDPFMGSGTTGVATIQLNRKGFIGIEKESKYFDICIKRIEQAIEERKVINEKIAHLPVRNANDYLH